MTFDEAFPIPADWLSDIDRSLADSVSRWAKKDVIGKRLAGGETPEFLGACYRTLAAGLGVQGLFFPEEAGGSGIETPDAAVTVATVIERAAHGDTGIAYLLANTFALQAALAVPPHRDAALLDRYASLFCGDDPAVASLVLPGYGTGAEAPAYHGLAYPVIANKTDAGWSLSGSAVRPQCAGANASLFGVAFDADGEPAAALVPGDANGLTRGEPVKKTGLAASVNADLTFDGVAIAEDQVVLRGESRFAELLAWHDLGCAAASAGALIAAWEILFEWGETRVIKGKGQVFRNNPLTASLMGEIGGTIATSRILTYQLARQLADSDSIGGSLHATAAAIAQRVCGGACDAIHSTMELMASAGYATEWNLERYWRDAKTIQTHLGPAPAANAAMARCWFRSEGV